MLFSCNNFIIITSWILWINVRTKLLTHTMTFYRFPILYFQKADSKWNL